MWGIAQRRKLPPGDPGKNQPFCHALGGSQLLPNRSLHDETLPCAHLEGANLQGVQLAKTIFSGANVNGCNVYGMSAWDLKLEGASQQNLMIRYRPAGEK